MPQNPDGHAFPVGRNDKRAAPSKDPSLAAAFIFLVLTTMSCIAPPTPIAASRPGSANASTMQPSLGAPKPTLAPTGGTTDTPTSTPTQLTESLEATVNADLLSCRYGPGAAYLFLYALRGGANIQLIGRTDGSNWPWVYVAGHSKCWVNSTFLRVRGDPSRLPIAYPGSARLPASPHYPPTAVLGATRQANEVTVAWVDVPLRKGDQEDERMQHYIVEVWHCESAQLLFEPFATNETFLTFVDEPGCSLPSHGRIYVQEKHGFAGPTEIPWPAFGQ